MTTTTTSPALRRALRNIDRVEAQAHVLGEGIEALEAIYDPAGHLTFTLERLRIDRDEMHADADQLRLDALDEFGWDAIEAALEEEVR